MLPSLVKLLIGYFLQLTFWRIKWYKSLIKALKMFYYFLHKWRTFSSFVFLIYNICIISFGTDFSNCVVLLHFKLRKLQLRKLNIFRLDLLVYYISMWNTAAQAYSLLIELLVLFGLAVGTSSTILNNNYMRNDWCCHLLDSVACWVSFSSCRY